VTLRQGRRCNQLLDIIKENCKRWHSIVLCVELALEKAMDLRTALFWAITQRVVVISDVSKQPFGPISKELGRISYPKTPVRNYNYTLHSKSKERSFHLLRRGSLKSRRPWTCRKADYRMCE